MSEAAPRCTQAQLLLDTGRLRGYPQLIKLDTMLGGDGQYGARTIAVVLHRLLLSEHIKDGPDREEGGRVQLARIYCAPPRRDHHNELPYQMITRFQHFLSREISH